MFGETAWKLYYLVSWFHLPSLLDVTAFSLVWLLPKSIFILEKESYSTNGLILIKWDLKPSQWALKLKLLIIRSPKSMLNFPKLPLPLPIPTLHLIQHLLQRHIFLRKSRLFMFLIRLTKRIINLMLLLNLNILNISNKWVLRIFFRFSLLFSN